MSTLTPITDSMWCATQAISPGPGVRMDTRMTVIAVPGRDADEHEVIVHSAIDVDDEMAAEIEALGRVAHVVSPNLFHHLFLEKAANRWPDATVWAPEGIEAKSASRVDRRMTEGELWPGIDVYAILGMPKFREFVLFHRATNTLLVTDLVFNKPVGHNVTSRLFFRFFGTYGKFAVSRLFKTMVKDKASCAASCRKLFDLPMERIVMAHGEVKEEGAAEAFRQAIEARL